ncbi:hypothetical protein T4B_7204 [Trichinella pseudospiralis]|uniref:Uncharacterized protein n=1 Tax=Trichinella pseudospiralis TaxID=6337 RepID=A0A0V1GHG0_TRIPS|nr:hypothetical protein T4B_7204 [Trichinella pseudospiralis]
MAVSYLLFKYCILNVFNYDTGTGTIQNEIHALNILAILEIKYTVSIFFFLLLSRHSRHQLFSKVHAADTLVLSMTIYGKVWCMPFRHLQIS